MWLFHLRSIMNIQPFSPIFPLLGYGCGMLLIIPSEFQEITHQPFPVAQTFQKSAAVIEKALSEHMVVLLHQYTEIYTFFTFPLVGSMIGGFYWLFLWNFKK